MKHSTHIMVVYDGTANSVFHGQVVAPLITYRANDPDTPIVLISFEKNTNQRNYHALHTQLKTHNITLIIARKYPLLHLMSLTPACWQLKKIVTKFPQYTLVARGPLAGYLCLKAFGPGACTSLTIQARGLLACEYEYATRQETSSIKRFYHRYKIALFENIEKTVYRPHAPAISLEAVSPALKKYLCTTYMADPAQITIAHLDIPTPISEDQKSTWRATTRATLGIADDTHVYCYNGSAKSWQCPKETIDYFDTQWRHNTKSFLLILTQDTNDFTTLIAAYNLPITSYRILQVPHAQIYQFLAACDTGIILRDAHPINWISRPTKILEYQAVGLSIVHNNTIGYLSQHTTQNSPAIPAAE